MIVGAASGARIPLVVMGRDVFAKAAVIATDTTAAHKNALGKTTLI